MGAYRGVGRVQGWGHIVAVSRLQLVMVEKIKVTLSQKSYRGTV